jgi:CubicO group peptidase (beta-lactamase class C family)
MIRAVVLVASLAAVILETDPATAQPRFRADGPEADRFGRSQGYPSCKGLDYLRDLHCRVGAFSGYDTLFPSRTIAAPASPSSLRRAPEPSVRYPWAGGTRTLDQYLDAHPVTSFLVAKGDTILVERYQYGRTDRQRLTSFSMAKTVIGLLIGLAVEDGAIRSVDDPAELYATGLKDTEYGRTPIKALLQMTSGVRFRETYSLGEVASDSDIMTLAALTLGQDPGGSVEALKRFNTRNVAPGRVFSYSSAESLVLGLVLAGATGRAVADYARDRLWAPLGAEADAAWVVDATGQEITYGYFNAVLRDWARLGLMLAHGGEWQGKRVVSRAWLEATAAPGPSAAAGSASRTPGYGYQTWLLMDDHRSFALRGIRGQLLIVDPELKLILVQTSLRQDLFDEVFTLWAALRSVR